MTPAAVGQSAFGAVGLVGVGVGVEPGESVVDGGDGRFRCCRRMRWSVVRGRVARGSCRWRRRRRRRWRTRVWRRRRATRIGCGRATRATNVGLYSNVASATTGAAPPPSSTLVAAYAFDEGSGSSVADLSGNGNTGQIGTATWTTSGKYGSALTLQRLERAGAPCRTRRRCELTTRDDAGGLGVSDGGRQRSGVT